MPDPLLASVADLRDFLGDSTLPLDDGRATFLLDAASALIRKYTDQFLTEVTDDEITVRGSGREILLLPQMPVTDVSEVVEDDEALVADDDFAWDSVGRLRRVGSIYPVVWSKWSTITVTYSHGFAEIPSDLRLACCQIAAKFRSRPETPGSLESETIGDYSYTVGTTGALGVPLLDEKSTLDRYRLVGVA